MASIEKKGDNYIVTVSNGYDSKGKKIRKKKTFKKPDNLTPKKWEKELHRLILEFEKKIQSGTYIDSNISLKIYTDQWLENYATYNLQPNTILSYEYELNSKILPALGHLSLEKLTPIRIQSFLNNLMEDGVRIDGKHGGYSNRTIKYQGQILSSMLQQAVYWQILPDNPCKRVKIPKNTNNSNKEYSNEKIKFFNQNEILTLSEIVKYEPLKYHVAFNIALFCGLRKGEILGLTWNDIDYNKKTLSVNKARTYIPKIGMITKEPKSKNSIRVVSIPNMLIKLLKEYKVWQNGEKATCGDLWSKEWNNTPWILTQWNGKGMDYSVLSQWLKKLITKHNKKIQDDNSIPSEEKESYILPVLSFHKLRHTSATLLIGENTDIRTVSHRLGHSQTSTTMNIYVHGLLETDQKAADTLEDFFSDDNKETNRSKKFLTE